MALVSSMMIVVKEARVDNRSSTQFKLVLINDKQIDWNHIDKNQIGYSN